MEDAKYPMEALGGKKLEYGYHNEVLVLERRLQLPSSFDPIKRLPPEVVVLVIRESVLSERSEVSRILELTGVSPAWQRFLVETPVLWGQLLVDDAQPDLLATLATSIRLSTRASLRLVIYERPINDWTALNRVLKPVIGRIASLTVIEMNTRRVGSEDALFSATASVLTHLGYPPSLRSLNFQSDKILDLPLSRYEPLNLPPAIDVVCTVVLTFLVFRTVPDSPNPLFSTASYQVLAQGKPKTIFSCNRSLSLYYNYRDKKVRIRNIGGTLPSIRRMLETLAGYFYLERFVHRASLNLRHFTGEILLSQAAELMDLLRLLQDLEELCLSITIEQTENTLYSPFNQSDVVIHTLRWIDFRLLGPTNSSSRVTIELERFFAEISSLYPAVEIVSIRSSDPFETPFFARHYLESLTQIRCLYLRNSHLESYYPADPITLGSLHTLYLQDAASHSSIDAPNLLHLHTPRINSDEQPSQAPYKHLRKLSLSINNYGRDGRAYNIKLDPSEYPVLSELTIKAFITHLSTLSFDYMRLTQLCSIRFQAKSLFHLGGNWLCVVLISSPDRLPSLEAVHFGHIVDYDLLFLMLEERNLGIRGVKKIRTISLPFIPCELRQPLEQLLLGNACNRPPLMSLSLEATREVLFDSKIPGCFACIKSMRSVCKEVIDPCYTLAIDVNRWREFYIPYDTMPAIDHPEISQWFEIRHNLVVEWAVSYGRFGARHHRAHACEWFTTQANTIGTSE